MFVVGTPGQHDAFAFSLVGSAPGWVTALHDMTGQKTLTLDPSNTPIAERQWVESRGGLLIILAAQPPADCTAGNLEVHVTRQADQKEAIVEFDLDPAAQGPGCYTV
jgi:hypothetical protein